MPVVSAVVLYAIMWFVVMFVVLPFRLRTQADDGEIVPGTHAGAPVNFRVGRTMLIVTAWTTLAWGAVVLFVVFSGLGVRDIDFFHRMGPPVN
jgi:predicted secreted protein